MDKQQIKISFDYDQYGDVLYITLGTGEPAYCEETDDLVVVERGMFSNQVVGFQILHVRDLGIKKVEIAAVVQKALEKEEKLLDKYLKNRKEFIRKVPNKLKRSPDLNSLFQQIGIPQ
jgi:uncharacterized protein YuzE